MFKISYYTSTNIYQLVYKLMGLIYNIIDNYTKIIIDKLLVI